MDDDEAAAAIGPHLAPEEKLLWAGRPTASLYAWNNGVGLIIVALMLAFGTVIYSFWTVLIVLAGAIGVGFFLHRKAKSVRYGMNIFHTLYNSISHSESCLSHYRGAILFSCGKRELIYMSHGCIFWLLSPSSWRPFCISFYFLK